MNDYWTLLDDEIIIIAQGKTTNKLQLVTEEDEIKRSSI
jgi:maltose-binding protein MalE